MIIWLFSTETRIIEIAIKFQLKHDCGAVNHLAQVKLANMCLTFFGM